MSIRGVRDRVVQIAYRLKDDFSSRIGLITGGFRRIEAEAEASTRRVGLFGRALRSAGSAVRSLGGILRGGLIGIFVSLAGALASAVSGLGRFREQLDSSAKAARALGESVSNLTALEYAAELSGLAIKGLHKGLQQMVRAVSEAASGTGEAKDALGELGLEAQALEKLSPSEQLRQIAEAMGDIGNQSDKVRIAEKLFGARNANGFLNLLNAGADGIDRMTQAAEKLGRVYSDEQARLVEQYNDRLTALGSLWDGFLNRARIAGVGTGNALLAALGIDPVVEDTLDAVNRRIETLNREIDAINNKPRELKLVSVGTDAVVLTRYRKELDELVKQRDALLDDKKIRDAQRRQEAAEREHVRKMAALRKQSVDGLKGALKERQAAYKQHLAELKQLQADEQAVADEFGRFVNDIQSGGSGKGDFIDAANLRLQAQNALRAGDFEGAIKKAREAKRLVEELKAEGNDSTVSLLGLAKSLERIANAAAKARTAAKQDDVAREKQALDEIEQRIKNLPKIQLQIDSAAFDAEVDKLRAQLARNPVVVPVVADVQGAGAQDAARALHREALRRGDVR